MVKTTISNKPNLTYTNILAIKLSHVKQKKQINLHYLIKYDNFSKINLIIYINNPIHNNGRTLKEYFKYINSIFKI